MFFKSKRFSETIQKSQLEHPLHVWLHYNLIREPFEPHVDSRRSSGQSNVQWMFDLRFLNCLWKSFRFEKFISFIGLVNPKKYLMSIDHVEKKSWTNSDCARCAIEVSNGWKSLFLRITLIRLAFMKVGLLKKSKYALDFFSGCPISR